MLSAGNYIVSRQPFCGCRNSGDCAGDDCSGPSDAWGDLYQIKCPFCRVHIGAADTEIGHVIAKKFIGRHLARYHQGDMTALARQRRELQEELEKEYKCLVAGYLDSIHGD
jgi:hypothetical protein